MNDEVRRAYARFGLPTTASAAVVRRRFRTLVRIWHPDRFSSDPQWLREATDKMAQINRDYQLLSQSQRQDRTDEVKTPRVPKLTTKELEGLVNAIGTAGPIDALLGGLDRILFVALYGPFGFQRASEYRSTFLDRVGPMLLVIISGGASAGCIAMVWVQLTLGDELDDPIIWLFILAAAVLGFTAFTEARKLRQKRAGARDRGRRTRA